MQDQKLEEQQYMFKEQLDQLKQELRDTREQRNVLKKKLDDAITLQDGEKGEIMNILRNALEKLIIEINLTSKIKEFLTVILRVLGYTDDQIILIYQAKEQKKKGLLTIFKKN